MFFSSWFWKNIFSLVFHKQFDMKYFKHTENNIKNINTSKFNRLTFVIQSQIFFFFSPPTCPQTPADTQGSPRETLALTPLLYSPCLHFLTFPSLFPSWHLWVPDITSGSFLVCLLPMECEVHAGRGLSDLVPPVPGTGSKYLWVNEWVFPGPSTSWCVFAHFEGGGKDNA